MQANPVTCEIVRERIVFHNVSNRLGVEIRYKHILAGLRTQKPLFRVVQPKTHKYIPVNRTVVNIRKPQRSTGANG